MATWWKPGDTVWKPVTTAERLNAMEDAISEGGSSTPSNIYFFAISLGEGAAELMSGTFNDAKAAILEGKPVIGAIMELGDDAVILKEWIVKTEYREDSGMAGGGDASVALYTIDKTTSTNKCVALWHPDNTITEALL